MISVGRHAMAAALSPAPIASGSDGGGDGRAHTRTGMIIGRASGDDRMNAPTTCNIIDGIAYPPDVTSHPPDGNTWLSGCDEWQYSDDNRTIQYAPNVNGNDGVPFRTIRAMAGYCAGVHKVDVNGLSSDTSIGLVTANYGDWHGRPGVDHDSYGFSINGIGEVYSNGTLLGTLPAWSFWSRIRFVLDFDTHHVQIW